MIKLICNIDGVPLTKSSRAQFWPILGKMNFKGYKITPFVITLYYGNGKPEDFGLFLKEFVSEINMSIRDGLVYNGITILLVYNSLSGAAVGILPHRRHSQNNIYYLLNILFILL